METVVIYSLNCPNTGRARYVGKTNNPYGRYEEHLRHSRCERTHKACWIRSLLATGQTPVLEVLDEVPVSEWTFWECEWIRLYRALGFDLTNGTDGGEDPPVSKKGRFTAEARAKISARMAGRVVSDETRTKLRVLNIGKTIPAAVRAKISATTKGRLKSQEHRAKIGAAHLGKSRGSYRIKH